MSKDKVLLSLALAVFIVFLWSVFTEPVYADDPPDAMIWPGDGGGGSLPPQTIEGYVCGASGVNVYIDYGAMAFETTPNAYGYFKFDGPWIDPYMVVWLSVNGKLYDLGRWCDNKLWNQWRGCITTDENGYAWETIHLGRAAIVEVPAAALFSNTKYATLSYGMGTTSSFSHTISFSVAASGIDAGYTTTTAAEYIFVVGPLTQAYVAKYHYAATFWDGLKPGIAKTGISGTKKTWGWGTVPTEEYLDPNNLPEDSYKDFRIAYGTSKQAKYAETGSYTWSATGGVPFAIFYPAFGSFLSLDTTVKTKSGHTNWVSYLIDRIGDTNTTPVLYFRAYTAGANLDPDNEKGGMELHVWDISGAG